MLHPVLLVGKDGRVMLHPTSAQPQVRSPVFLATVSESGELTGNLLTQGGAGLKLTPVWSLAVQGKVYQVVSRPQAETVHSAGRLVFNCWSRYSC